MHRSLKKILPLLLLGCCAAFAVAADDAIDSEAQCAELSKVELPVADMPKPADRTSLQGCDSSKLYYGAGAAPDYRGARLCAYMEREGEEQPEIGGAAVLMMIYANGRGIERDIDLARRFACETDGAPAELEGRLEHLTDIAELDASEVEFDICDDITSGYMSGVCARLGAEAAALGRVQRMHTLQKSWPPGKRSAYAILRRTADAYFQSRLEGEVDISGSARGAFVIGEQESLEDGFLQHLLDFDAGRLPRGDAEALKRADAALNAAYAEAMKQAKPENPDDTFGMLGSVRPEGIRAAERLWIRYRDAWADFGTSQYPDTTRDAWLHWQTEERTRMLRALVGEE
jgi:uncharacterized protein YecT (DUF1311 family)